MSRLIFSISVIVVLLTVSFISIIGVKNTKEQIFIHLDKSISYVLDKNPEKAKQSAKIAYNIWIKKQKILTYFIDDTDIHEVALILSGVGNLIDEENPSEFFYQLQKAKTSISQIYASQLPTLQSIF